MRFLKPVLAAVLLASVAMPTIAMAHSQRDGTQPFFWPLVDQAGQERLAGRFRGGDDDDRRWRGGRGDDDDDRGRGGRGDDDDDDGRRGGGDDDDD